MVRPIPRKFLPHTVTYEEYEEGGRYGDTYKDPVTFQFVRVDELTSRALSQLSDSNQHTHTLIFDVVSSVATKPVQFTVKSKITFEGQELTVQKVNPLRTFNQIHHYELELI